MDVFYIGTRIIVFISIGLLLIGWKLRDTRGHGTSMVGWLLFGIYWLLMVPHYLDKGELVNAIYCILGFPLFAFLMYHEQLSIKWGDDPASLAFMAGTVGISAGMYFLIDTFPQVAAFFIWTTAYATAGFLTMFGYEAHIGDIRYDSDMVRVPIYHGDQGGISIILACTAIQSVVIFIAAILTTRAERDRKWKAFFYTVPVILILNVVRTAAVVYLVYEDITSFDMAHNNLSRWGSMLVLIVLAFYMFDILPELHDNIIGIPGLLKREKPGSEPEKGGKQVGGVIDGVATKEQLEIGAVEEGRGEIGAVEKRKGDVVESVDAQRKGIDTELERKVPVGKRERVEVGSEKMCDPLKNDGEEKLEREKGQGKPVTKENMNEKDVEKPQ